VESEEVGDDCDDPGDGDHSELATADLEVRVDIPLLLEFSQRDYQLKTDGGERNVLKYCLVYLNKSTQLISKQEGSRALLVNKEDLNQNPMEEVAA